MRIKDTQQITEVTKDLMLPLGNTPNEDPAHITLEQIKEYTNVDVQANINVINTSIAQAQDGINYIGNKVDEVEIAINTLNTQVNKTETWKFELEDGTVITKQILVK